LARLYSARNLRRTILYLAVYLSAASAFLLPATMPVLRSTSDFSIYNRGWNGCSEFAIRLYQSGKQVYPLHTPFRTIRNRPDDANTALVVIGPTRPFLAGDSRYVEQFVRNGGTVILANDFDEGNSLLEGMGIGLRFSQYPIADLCFDKDSSIVTCYSLATNNPLTENVSSFLLNHPAGIVGQLPKGAVVLAKTSEMSWLDKNGDGKWQIGDETRGPFPVLVDIPYGEGEVILLSDPSIFLNSMIKEKGNEQLYENLVRRMTGREITRIYIDEEHRTLANPVEFFTVVIRRQPDYQRLVVVWTIVTALLFVVSKPLRHLLFKLVDGAISLALWILSLGARQKESRPGDPVEQCMRRHPEWDARILRRIADSAL